MRINLLCLFLLPLAFNSLAQNPLQRTISLKRVGSDSLHIPFNANYHLTEDSCALITRQARYNMQQRFFYGKFKDISRQDTSLVLAEGFYNANGLIHGSFVSYYLNGKPQARGSYKEGQPDGEWQLFYNSGNPKLTFTAADGRLTVKEAWSEDGAKVVDNGTGNYQARQGLIIWTGKLLEGKPDGTWVATSHLDRSNKTMATEKFKDGKFLKGTGPLGSYTDASRIVWFDKAILPFLAAQDMLISSTPCHVPARTQIVGVQYKHGPDGYNEEIKKAVGAYLRNIDLKPYENELHLEGEVSEEGKLVNFRYKIAFSDKIATGLMRVLAKLPALEPALADGKPIRQGFKISFKFYEGVYSFNYQFLPIKLTQPQAL
ncbi:hypothetical protein SAMN05421739_104184 [Pontibacter chinhatensis]|uniref:MORN repeat variant n=2 Tax=Pontibacter chinhatensis TaxID=1436961 RepID=A0A1I2VLE7_9BACT|nr:hypothetical protein SAMN05421739_104184 [Pontibacter chinhatensis]